MSEHSVIGIMSKKILGKNPENYFLIEAGRTYTNKDNLTFFCPSFCTCFIAPLLWASDLNL